MNARNRKLTQTDAELVILSKKGDARAFAELVKRYELIVKKTTFSMCGREAGQDVAQEVFIRFYRKMEQYKGDAKLSTYLTRIAIRLSLNEIEKQKRSKDQETKYFAGDHTHEGAPGGQFEIREVIDKALAKLEPDFRSVIVLRLIEGYTVDETAVLLDLPRGTVASRLNRAQLKMQEYIQELNKNLNQ